MFFQKTREDLTLGRGVPNIYGFSGYLRYHFGFGNRSFYGFPENPWFFLAKSAKTRETLSAKSAKTRETFSAKSAKNRETFLAKSQSLAKAENP